MKKKSHHKLIHSGVCKEHYMKLWEKCKDKDKLVQRILDDAREEAMKYEQ
jgi:hypothetical protein